MLSGGRPTGKLHLGHYVGAFKTFAELKKDVVIVGMDSRIEIWSKDRWEKCDEDLSPDEVAEKMEMLGI